MSFHSTKTKTLKELQMLNTEKAPTKYILSLYKRTNIHLNQIAKYIDTNCYNDYLNNKELFCQNKHSIEEKEYITLKNFSIDLKKILDKKEHLNRHTC